MLPPKCWFWCTRHQNHETITPSVSIKTDSKSIKRTQNSPNELKFQKVYVCDFHIFLVYGQNGVKAPRLMRNVVKHARCSGSTATYKLKHYTNNIIAYNCYVGVIWWMCDRETHRFSPKRSYRSILIQTHQKSEQIQTLKIKQDFEAPGIYIYIYKCVFPSFPFHCSSALIAVEIFKTVVLQIPCNVTGFGHTLILYI